MGMFSSEDSTISITWNRKMSVNQTPEPDPNPVEAILNTLDQAERRSHWIIVIGAPTWVRKIIHLMHVARITEVRDWSRLTPTRHPDQVISLIQRPRGGAEEQV